MIVQPDQRSATTWRKSRASADQGACVEISFSGSHVLIRDSRDKSGVVIKLTPNRWLELLTCIRNEGISHRS